MPQVVSGWTSLSLTLTQRMPSLQHHRLWLLLNLLLAVAATTAMLMVVCIPDSQLLITWRIMMSSVSGGRGGCAFCLVSFVWCCRVLFWLHATVLDVPFPCHILPLMLLLFSLHLSMHIALSQSVGVLVDTFRYFHPSRQNAYTCWSTVTGARKTNFGTRIDYILADEDFVKRYAQAGDIMPEVSTGLCLCVCNSVQLCAMLSYYWVASFGYSVAFVGHDFSLAVYVRSRNCLHMVFMTTSTWYYNLIWCTCLKRVFLQGNRQHGWQYVCIDQETCNLGVINITLLPSVQLHIHGINLGIFLARNALHKFTIACIGIASGWTCDTNHQRRLFLERTIIYRLL